MPDLPRRCVRPACLVLVPLAAASVFGAAPTKQAGRDLGYNALGAPALTPAEQLRTFTVPTGVEVELVAAEGDGIGKFITVDWDARGRLRTMTAFKYPVDANENAAACSSTTRPTAPLPRRAPPPPGS